MTRITKLKQLICLANRRGSVWLSNFHTRRLPAAVVINWSGVMIQRHMDAGMWRYVPKAQRKEAN